jgi:crotonobetainyl-CoA:carnitine CoA-transferase CaiB-like acyl-CoA transferase
MFPGVSAPLTDLRVLECGDILAVAYAGRELADLGAEVVKVEAPEGDPLRSVGPFVGGVPDGDLSGSFAYFNAGKRSVVIGAGPGRGGRLAELAGRAEVILRGTRGGDDWLSDAELLALRVADPSLIVVDVSTYGRQDERGPHPSSDLLALAASGFLSLNASEPGDPKATPLRYKGELSSIHAGVNAVLATLGALFERTRSGVGQRIDISAEAAVVGILATALSRFTYTGVLPVRNGTRGVAPWGFYHCRDGVVLIQCTEDAEFRRLLEIFGEPDWGGMEIFRTTAQRGPVSDVLDQLINAELSDMTQQAFLDLAFQHRVPAAPIHYANDILGWDHLAARGFLGPVAVTDGRRQAEIPLPGPPWRYRAEEPPLRRRVSPRLGDAGDDLDLIWAQRPRRRPAPQSTGEQDVPPPLAGVRVIDLTWVWAGPHATLQLANLGAEVIRIETAGRVDVTRRLGPFVDERPGVDRSGYFNQYNQGKKSVALNLKTEAGLELLRQLIARADVVIDNMSAGALDRMGLPYEELVRINPGIVAVSMTGFGETGPYRDHLAYGSLIDALSGTSSANGPVGGGPTDLVMSLPDPTAGLHAAVATVAALYRARTTGAAVRVECSMLEAFMAAFPWQVVFGGVTGHDAPVMGNRDEQCCPHEVFPCRDEDRWIAIAVNDDEQFAALAAAIGAPELGHDPRFRALELRRVHERALEAIVTGWTLTQDVDQAVETLRAAGVPAEKVARMDEVVRSPRLAARDYFTYFAHPEFGVRALAGVPWLTDRSPMRVRGPAPTLGQHTREVLTGVLDLTPETVDRLIDEGVAV